jgi:calcineurin-like phosphoesterase family protein
MLPGMIYVISDTHWNHANIIKYCDRPFKNVIEMNEALIKAWNDVVKPEDKIIHLGDFAMGKKHEIPGILARLNGYKVLIRGNHDRSTEFMLEAGFSEVYESMVYTGHPIYGGIFLSHKPQPDVYDLISKGLGPTGAKLAFHGHLHGSNGPKTHAIAFDVGVDCGRGYGPQTIEKIVNG